MDEIHFTPEKRGVFLGIIIPGFLRWCEMEEAEPEMTSRVGLDLFSGFGAEWQELGLAKQREC